MDSRTRVLSVDNVYQRNNYLTHQESLRAYTESAVSNKRPLKELTCYIFFASILWLVIGGIGFIVNQAKQNKLSDSKYTNYCCDCYDWATTNQSYKVGWSYCIDDAQSCTCDLCKESMNNLNETGKSCNYLSNITSNNDSMIMIDTFDDYQCSKDDEMWLSTSSLSFIDAEKNYQIYGIIALIVAFIMIIISLLHLNCIKTTDAGISLFIHNIIGIEIEYYVLFKSYQYYDFRPYDNEVLCTKDILTNDFEKALNIFLVGSFSFHIALNFILWCIGLCLKSSKSPKALNLKTKFTQYWHCTVSLFTIVCILWIFAIYIMITYQIGVEYDKNTKEENIWLIVAAVAISLQLFLIFFFPFCRKLTREIYGSLHPKYLCPKSYAISSEDSLTNFHELIDVRTDVRA